MLSGDLKRAVKAASPHSIEALSDLYAVIPEVKTAMTKMKLTLDAAEHEAAAARKALHQPADLKAVYDLAYEKLVDNPAHVMRQVPPKLETALTPLGTLAACLHAHRDAVSVLGNVIFPGDEAVRREVNALMENAARASRDIAETNRQLVSLAYGR